jgi:hypothetical protein
MCVLDLVHQYDGEPPMDLQELRNDMNTRFNRVNNRLDRTDHRITQMGDRLNNHMTELENQFVEGNIMQKKVDFIQTYSQLLTIPSCRCTTPGIHIGQ